MCSHLIQDFLLRGHFISCGTYLYWQFSVVSNTKQSPGHGDCIPVDSEHILEQRVEQVMKWKSTWSDFLSVCNCTHLCHPCPTKTVACVKRHLGLQLFCIFDDNGGAQVTFQKSRNTNVHCNPVITYHHVTHPSCSLWFHIPWISHLSVNKLLYLLMQMGELSISKCKLNFGIKVVALAKPWAVDLGTVLHFTTCIPVYTTVPCHHCWVSSQYLTAICITFIEFLNAKDGGNPLESKENIPKDSASPSDSWIGWTTTCSRANCSPSPDKCSALKNQIKFHLYFIKAQQMWSEGTLFLELTHNSPIYRDPTENDRFMM